MRGLRLIETRRARELRRSATRAESILWTRLRNRGLGGCKFVRQAPIGPFIVDLLCRDMKLVLEIDGETHSTAEELAADRRRSRFLEQQGYCVVRVTNEDVFESVDGVLKLISAKLKELS